MMAISIRISGHEHTYPRPRPAPGWKSMTTNDRIIGINKQKTYPVILPELDRPVGPVDTEGPAPRRGARRGADGVAGLEAPSHSEGAGGGFQGGVSILEGNAIDGKAAGELLGGGERKRGEGNAGNLHDGWRMWVLLLRSC